MKQKHADDQSSFSGVKLSAWQMDSHWLGRSGETATHAQTQGVELYLPEYASALTVS